jgi:hypothetical protein
MWYKASGGRGGVGLYRGARLGNELEEEEDTAYMWARRGSDKEKGAATCSFDWAGPLRDARERLASGRTGKELRAGPRREGRRPAGQNRDEEGFHFSFPFPIFQIHFQIVFEIISF